jgi:thiamine biosynthesis protein ThiC
MNIVRDGNDYEPQQISTHRLRELLRTEKAAQQTVAEMLSAVQLSRQFDTPVADHRLILDWAKQLQVAGDQALAGGARPHEPAEKEEDLGARGVGPK